MRREIRKWMRNEKRNEEVDEKSENKTEVRKCRILMSRQKRNEAMKEILVCWEKRGVEGEKRMNKVLGS